MHLNDHDREEKREKVRHRRFFIWGVMPSMLFLWGFALWVGIDYFLNA